MNAKDLMKIMLKAGWQLTYIRGSHHYFIHPEHIGKKISVPVHGAKDLHPATLASIKKATGLK